MQKVQTFWMTKRLTSLTVMRSFVINSNTIFVVTSFTSLTTTHFASGIFSRIIRTFRCLDAYKVFDLLTRGSWGRWVISCLLVVRVIPKVRNTTKTKLFTCLITIWANRVKFTVYTLSRDDEKVKKFDKKLNIPFLDYVNSFQTIVTTL